MYKMHVSQNRVKNNRTEWNLLCLLEINHIGSKSHLKEMFLLLLFFLDTLAVRLHKMVLKQFSPFKSLTPMTNLEDFPQLHV